MKLKNDLFRYSIGSFGLSFFFLLICNYYEFNFSFVYFSILFLISQVVIIPLLLWALKKENESSNDGIFLLKEGIRICKKSECIVYNWEDITVNLKDGIFNSRLTVSFNGTTIYRCRLHWFNEVSFQRMISEKILKDRF